MFTKLIESFICYLMFNFQGNIILNYILELMFNKEILVNITGVNICIFYFSKTNIWLLLNNKNLSTKINIILFKIFY
jgi:hypothetical protein